MKKVFGVMAFLFLVLNLMVFIFLQLPGIFESYIVSDELLAIKSQSDNLVFYLSSKHKSEGAVLNDVLYEPVGSQQSKLTSTEFVDSVSQDYWILRVPALVPKSKFGAMIQTIDAIKLAYPDLDICVLVDFQHAQSLSKNISYSTYITRGMLLDSSFEENAEPYLFRLSSSGQIYGVNKLSELVNGLTLNDSVQSYF